MPDPLDPPSRRHGPTPGSARRGFGAIKSRGHGRPYEASYIGPDGARHRAPITFKTKDSAVAWLESERRLIERDEWVSPASRGERARQRKKLTVAAYAAEWVESRNIRPSTRVLYDRLLARQINEVAELVPRRPATARRRAVPAHTVIRAGGLGDVPLAELTRERVRLWYRSLGDKTPRQRAGAYALLSSICRSAAEDGHLDANPCTIHGGGVAKRARRIEPATSAELAAIAAAMPERLRLAVTLSAWCALRAGECFELRRSDIAFSADGKRGVLRIERAVVWVSGQPQVGAPKTAAGRRDVAIPPHLLPEIRGHLLRHAQLGAKGLLFYTAEGRHINPGRLWRVFARARESAGRPDLRWHDLRHSGAVFAAQSGATLAELQARLGHTTAQMSLRYQHAAEGRDQLLAERLSARIAQG